MTKNKHKLTLDRKTAYRIIVPGQVQKLHLGPGTVETEFKEDGANGLPITILTGTFDQAGLYGLLRRLYAMGLPLMAVLCRDCDINIGSDLV